MPIALSPRQEQVLEQLLAGRSEKEAAAGLGISRHTVHVYVKSLYARFGVHSRAELMSRFVVATSASRTDGAVALR